MKTNTGFKLVLAWVDMDGFEVTEGYRDSMNYHRKTKAVPQAKATCWSYNTPDRMKQLLSYIEAEKKDHLWMGWFLLPYDGAILNRARAQALQVYKAQAALIQNVG